MIAERGKLTIPQLFTDRSSSIRDVPRILDIVVMFALISYLVIYILHACQYILYPYQLDYGEGYMLYYASLLAHGHSIYPNLPNYPFIPGLYPPLYPLLCAPFVKIFGLSFVAGRTISAVSALLIGLVIYRIVSFISDQRSGLVASLFFFASTFVFLTTAWYREDTLGLLFSLTGVFFIIKHAKDKAVYLSIPFFLLAVFTKQSYLLAPVVSIIYLIFKDKRLGLKIGGLFIIIGASIFIILNHLTSGQFYLQTISYQSFAPVLQLVVQRYGDFLSGHLIIFCLAFILATYTLLQRKWKLLSLYFFAAAIAAVTVGRPGASSYYFLELIAVCSILAGLAYHRFYPQIKKGSLAGFFISVLLLTQLTIFSHGPYDHLAKDLKTNEQISSLIQSTSGQVLTEDAGQALLNGKNLYIEWFMATQLNMQGKWDQSTFIDELQSKKYSLIILKNDARIRYNLLTLKGSEKLKVIQQRISYNQRYSAKMLSAIITNYHLTGEVGEYYIYKPNQ